MTVNPTAQILPKSGIGNPLHQETNHVGRSMAYYQNAYGTLLYHGTESGHHPQMQDPNLCYGIPTSISTGGEAGLGKMEPPSSDEDQDHKPHTQSSFDEIQNGAGSGKQSESSQTPGKKAKGKVKIKMEFIDNKLRRYTTFSKRKTGIMKKAYELSTLTGTQVMLLVASETGHVYTFATRKLQPMITSEAGKALIQTCLNSPEPGTNSNPNLRMTETGYEEQDLSYTVEDRDGEEGEELEDDIYEREAKPQVGGVTSRDGSPDCVLPALEDVPVVPPSIISRPAPLMTIPPHVLSQLLTTTTTTTSTSTSTDRHTAFTPVNPPLVSPPSAFFTKQQQQQQQEVSGKERREKRRNILDSSSSSVAASHMGPALLSSYSLPHSHSHSQSINIQEILAHLKHPPQSEA